MRIADRAILVMIDGLRPDALAQAETPALHRLMVAGAHTLTAATVYPEITLPCHTSLFFSLPPQQHGILTNTWQPLPAEPPGLMDLIHQQGRTTAAVYSWEPLRDLSRPDSLDFSYYHRHTDPEHDGRELELAAAAADNLVREEPAFTFLYIELVDLIGHLSGWMSPAYLEAVSRADRALELVLDELEAAGLLESTALMVTADHGGHERWHGPLGPQDPSLPEDHLIPLILSGAGVHKGQLLEQPVSILDFAPTLAAWLGLPPPAAWQGRVLQEAFED